MIISIVVPIYNVEKYLSRCIESILAQTYKQLEIILVNDGSIDNSLILCKKYQNLDARIKVIDQPNAGPANARNNGIKIAQGNYIGFVDSDDEIKIDFFEKLASAAISTKADVICSDIILETKNGHTSVLKNELPKNKIIDKAEIKNLVLQNYYGGELGNIASMCNKLYKTTFLKENNLLIDESRIRAEDYWFNFYAFSKANSCLVIDYAGYLYKVSNGCSVMKSFRENQFEGFLRTRRELEAANEILKLNINQVGWDTQFINNSNEFILLAIKNKRLDIVHEILKNKDYREALRNYKTINLHTKLIKFFNKFSFDFFTIQIYKLWSTKLN